MRVTDILVSAFDAGAANQDILGSRWLTHSHRFAQIAGVAQLMNLQTNGRLDLLLRQLEQERLNQCAPDEGHSLTLQSFLSECWALQAYEVIRAAAERNKSDVLLGKLRDRFALVRMPLAKVEIAGMKRKNAHSLTLELEDGSRSRTYSNDGKYVVPRQLCVQTGSIIWLPADIVNETTVAIRRIDLSDEFLGHLG